MKNATFRLKERKERKKSYDYNFNFNLPFRAGLHDKTLLRKAHSKGISLISPS